MIEREHNISEESKGVSIKKIAIQKEEACSSSSSSDDGVAEESATKKTK